MNDFNKNFTSAFLSETVSIGGLKLYPINFDNNKLPFKISTFDQLYDIEKVEANEIGEEGIVSKIEIHNKSSDYLVIFDGEAIIGAKQNRISEQTVIILPNSKTIIRVYYNQVHDHYIYKYRFNQFQHTHVRIHTHTHIIHCNLIPSV